MANQKNQGGRPQPKQDKNPGEQTMRDPIRKPDAEGADIERDRSSRERDEKGVDSGSVISNDEEVESDASDVAEDEESNQITGRHPSQRDRDLK